MTFVGVPLHAYCPTCGKKVTASTILGGDDLKRALSSNLDVEVMHIANIDHRWKLNEQDKRNLIKFMAEQSG